MKNWVALLILVISFGICGQAVGTELMPWTEEDLELYPRFEYNYQHYNRVHSSHHFEHQCANDHFYTLGIAASYDVWSAELEATCAATRHCSFYFEDFKGTLRYRLLNDIIADPVSLIAGVSLIRASGIALHDLSVFHHGQNEFELHLSVGKECTVKDTWSSRWWCVGLFGLGDHGSPWWRTILAWEKNYCKFLFRGFVEGLYGMGGNSLNVHDFDGYGSVRHRSIDIGARLTKETVCYGIWKAEYAYRVWAYNYPANASLVRLSITYPFGL